MKSKNLLSSTKSNKATKGRNPKNSKGKSQNRNMFFTVLGKHSRALLSFLLIGCIGTYFLVQTYASTPTVPVSTFNVTTWNSNFANKHNIGKELVKLGVNSDIIAVQEAHKYYQRNNIKSALLCKKCTYSGYMPENKYYKSHNGSSMASLPILWNKSKFKLLEKGYVKSSDTRKGIKDSTGNNAKVSAKYVTWVHLRDISTGRSFYVLNTHTVASVESGGKPNSNKVRNAIFDKNMNALVSLIQRLQKTNRPILLAGDFNVNYRYDALVQNPRFPFAKLGELGLHSTYERLNFISTDSTSATQGNSSRLIDYIYTSNHMKLSVSHEYIDSETYGSDHHPISATMVLLRSDPTKNVPSTAIGTSNPPTTSGVADENSAVAADAY